MAQSRLKKKLINMAYGLGASIVIIGALFKITHFQVWIFSGNVMLAIGLITEAIIFAISAFEPIDDDLDWALVYPELAGGKSQDKKDKKAAQDAEALLSKKLDELLKEAKIDGELIDSLGKSIRGFEGAAKVLLPSSDSLNATKKYGEELTLAASQMESLNNLYKVQLESVNRQAEVNEEVTQTSSDTMNASKKYSEELSLAAAQMESLNSLYKVHLESVNRQAVVNEEVVENTDKLKEQLSSLTTNLSSLNGVYGSMLSAMGKNS